MGIETPADLSGSECSFTSAIIAVEELAKVDASVAVMVDVHNTLVNTVIRLYGSDAIKERWLPGLATDTVSCPPLRSFEQRIDRSGRIFLFVGECCWQVSIELVSDDVGLIKVGSDAFALQTTAKKDSNGDYILNGTKA